MCLNFMCKMQSARNQKFQFCKINGNHYRIGQNVKWFRRYRLQWVVTKCMLKRVKSRISPSFIHSVNKRRNEEKTTHQSQNQINWNVFEKRWEDKIKASRMCASIYPLNMSKQMWIYTTFYPHPHASWCTHSTRIMTIIIMFENTMNSCWFCVICEMQTLRNQSRTNNNDHDDDNSSSNSK